MQKSKMFDQSQGYFNFTFQKISLKIEKIESLDSFKNLFEPFFFFIRNCECFYNFKSLLYKVILVSFSSPLYQSLFPTIKDSIFNGMTDYQDHEP